MRPGETRCAGRLQRGDGAYSESENRLAHDLTGFHGPVGICHVLESKRGSDLDAQIARIKVRCCLLQNPPLALSLLGPPEH